MTSPTPRAADYLKTAIEAQQQISSLEATLEAHRERRDRAIALAAHPEIDGRPGNDRISCYALAREIDFSTSATAKAARRGRAAVINARKPVVVKPVLNVVTIGGVLDSLPHTRKTPPPAPAPAAAPEIPAQPQQPTPSPQPQRHAGPMGTYAPVGQVAFTG